MDQFHYWFYMESPLIFPSCDYTFYQPVFYATHDQHFPSESKGRTGFCGDAMTHKLLDKITPKIIYRSAVRQITKSNPNHRLTEDGGEASTSKQPSSKYQLSLSDQDRMMLIHLTSSLCLNLILMT